ncbi:acyl-CoA N-acyltransferase [Xylariomycetidae sp. FL0641]|nr:acyl-CoA N-acyltransferase [Xylariomycetidae sp. FL0641]
MPPSVVYLPDGQSFTVQPVFSGLFFKSNDLNIHPTPFPAGWTVVLHSEDNNEEQLQDLTIQESDNAPPSRRSFIHKYSKPTLQNDTIFISSISNPSSTEYRPHSSPSRQIALMLWVTLHWYFQQPEPSPYLETERSKYTPLEAKPRGDWRIQIKRDGVFRTRNMIPKLERMGLISSFDSAVGTSILENSEGWDQMFVSRRMFWQIHMGLFLFTLQPLKSASPNPDSPVSSRPTSPVRSEFGHKRITSVVASPATLASDLPGGPIPTSVTGVPSFPIGPYYSSSHLPTFYPPAPVQYTISNHVRHPLRQKPPRMGESFYTRFIPSVGRYLSFRVASLSHRPVPCLGPVGPNEPEQGHLNSMTDTALLKMWLENPRVTRFWGQYHDEFLPDALRSRHSFPVIGMWDNIPFGYFEIYWVKEDQLGQQMGNEAQDFDRGVHVLVGEEWARGKVAAWLTSLVHWCWQADYRTMNVCLEPRVDNDVFLHHLQEAGFAKERQISFPHKQAWLCRLRREDWDGPAL